MLGKGVFLDLANLIINQLSKGVMILWIYTMLINKSGSNTRWISINMCLSLLFWSSNVDTNLEGLIFVISLLTKSWIIAHYFGWGCWRESLSSLVQHWFCEHLAHCSNTIFLEGGAHGWWCRPIEITWTCIPAIALIWLESILFLFPHKFDFIIIPISFLQVFSGFHVQ